MDKIGTVAKGVFIVHMKSVEGLAIACEYNGILFDKKPFVVKSWSNNISYEKEHISTIPIWVRFTKLVIHYRGERCLTLIARMLGSVVRTDNATKNKDRMQFARVLVELSIDGEFYDTISFTNEDDELMTITVEYDWKPSKCSKCKQKGHVEDACRVGLIHKLVPKPGVVIENTETDAEGFRMVTSRKAAGKQIMGSEKAIVLDTRNGFEVLNDDSILAWNVRGLYTAKIQSKVARFLSHHHVSLFSLLETKVKHSNLGLIYQRLCPSWCFSHNLAWSYKGRIMIGWKHDEMVVNISFCSSQIIHL